MGHSPGRHDGTLAHRHTAAGTALVGDFHYAELAGADGSGRWLIRQYENDREPGCARGKITCRLLTWNGVTSA